MTRRCRRTSMLAAIFAVSVPVAPQAAAEPVLDVAAAVESARADSTCAPYQRVTAVEQAAEVFNRMTDDYLSHTAKRVPTAKELPGAPVDTLPGLQHFGYTANKAYLLQGADHDPAIAVKGAILEGLSYGILDDCTYTDIGVNMRQNADTGFHLVAVIVAAR